jgi:predicted transcriptional regulator
MSGHTTVRISKDSRSVLKQLAQDEGRTMQAVFDDALDAYQRTSFLNRLNRELAALQSDGNEVTQAEAEQELWDKTLLDGLPEDECWTDDGESLKPGEVS